MHNNTVTRTSDLSNKTFYCAIVWNHIWKEFDRIQCVTLSGNRVKRNVLLSHGSVYINPSILCVNELKICSHVTKNIPIFRPLFFLVPWQQTGMFILDQFLVLCQANAMATLNSLRFFPSPIFFPIKLAYIEKCRSLHIVLTGL